MARRAAFLEKVRSDPGHRLVITGGDFFPQGGGSEEKHKGAASLRAVRLMNYDAVGLGDQDFLYGSELLNREIKGLPVVTTNLVWAATGKPIGQQMILKTYRGLPYSGLNDKALRVAVLSILDDRMQSSLDFYLDSDPAKVRVLPTVATAQEWVKKARAQADVVVVLLHENAIDAAAFAQKVPGIDVIVGGHTVEEIVTAPKRQGDTWIVANGDRARYVGELRFTFEKPMRLSEPVPRQIPLDASVGEDSAVARIVQDYKKALEEERGKASLNAKPADVPTTWATASVCSSCHREIVEAWNKTAHASAYKTLALQHEEARNDCLKCHVVGLGTPGGFSADAPQAVLEGVQCESCHGSGVKHVVAATADKKKTIVGHPSPSICVDCHNLERDAKFDFKTAWAKIRH